MNEKFASPSDEKLKDDPTANAANTAKEKTESRENVSSNADAKIRQPSEHVQIDADQDKRATPSTSGPKGTEEPGSDEGPGGTGW